MSIALTVKHLLACGASHEAVVKAVEEIEAAEALAEEEWASRKRALATERQRRHRDKRDKRDRVPLSPPMIYNSTPSIPSQNISIKSAKLLSEEPLFEGFWAVYPRKVGKGAALKAYRHALKRASHAEIAAGAKRYAASKPDPQYTAHASTWLNADRWLDEPDRKPGASVVGFHKEFKPEPEGPKVTEEERQANLAKLATIKFGTKKL
jgi:hypothetical protein